MNRKYDVMCVGLAVVNFPIGPVDETLFRRDLTQVDKIELLSGGDAVNQAIILSRMKLKTTLMTAIGADGFGEILLKSLNADGKGIDLSKISIYKEDSTGVCAMLIAPDGQRNFCIHRGALLKFGIDDIDCSLLSETKVVSIGGFMSLPAFDGDGSRRFLKRAKEQGAITVVDTKKDLWGIGFEGIRETLPYIDYFFPSIDEAKEITGKEAVEEIADIFLQAGVKNVGIKLGSEGSYFKNAAGEFYTDPYPCDVIDTTGSGDNFMAGFITGILQGWNLQKCCKFAGAIGAINATMVGPTKAVQSFEQVIEFQKEKE